MLAAKLKKIINQIRRLGIYGFIFSKMNEKYHSSQLKKIGVQYPQNYYGYLNANQQSVNRDCKMNQPFSYYIEKKGFKGVGKRYSEMSLLDVGCGDGKVINFAMLLNFKKVIGIDLDELAVQRALDNCNQMKNMGCNVPFKVYYADASKYMIPEGTNVIFMFNPFGRQTMETVLNNIVQYCNAYNTELHVIYITPVHQDVFNHHIQCCKIYEMLNSTKTNAETIVFKINHK